MSGAPRAYDYDGVLAGPPPKPAISWRRMHGDQRAAWRRSMLEHYAATPAFFRPDPGPFHVITARREGEQIRAVSEAWLNRHYPGRWLALHMLRVGRTLENVVAYKAALLRELGVVDYFEDNLQVVRGLRAACPGVRVWRVTAKGASCDEPPRQKKPPPAPLQGRPHRA